MLLYALLYLAGVRKVMNDTEVTDELSVSLDEIKHFRQLGSRGGACSTHPEICSVSCFDILKHMPKRGKHSSGVRHKKQDKRLLN